MKKLKIVRNYIARHAGLVAKLATYATCVWIATALVKQRAIPPLYSFTPTTVEVPIWIPAKGRLLNEPGPVVFDWTETSARNVICLTSSEAFDAVAKRANEVEVMVLREGRRESRVSVRWFAYTGETAYRLYKEVVPPEPNGAYDGSFSFSKPAITGDGKISWTSVESGDRGIAAALFYLMGIAGGMLCGLFITKGSEYLWVRAREGTNLPPSAHD